MNRLRKIRSRRSLKNGGYVLLLVLLVLTIAATAMVWFTDGSCRKSLEASEACRALQVRWGSLSLSRLMMDRPEVLLSSAASGGVPGRFFQTKIDLGGLTFCGSLWDEQAKANVNTLAGRLKSGDFDAAVRQLAASGGASLPQAASAPAEGFWSPCQLISSSDPGAVFNSDDCRHSVVASLTCWGDGRINIKKADPAVMDIALDGILNRQQIDQLASFAKDHPDCTLAEALTPLNLTGQAANDAGQALTDRSACYSLWVTADNGLRKWYNLYVKNTQAQGGFSRFSFTWP